MSHGAPANLNLRDVKIEKRLLRVMEKGGHTHGYKISRQGLEAILDYLAQITGRTAHSACHDSPSIKFALTDPKAI